MAFSLDVSSFYGENYCSKPKNYLSPCHVKNYTTIVPFPCKNLTSDPDTAWKVFKKQDNLLVYLQCKSLMPFVFESGQGGVRSFLAAHPRVFWHYDEQKKLEERSAYEIIREFTACKLYFDLEFNMLLNPNRDGVQMVRLFINVVIFFLREIFGVICGEADVINLDSTTEIKFSQHLIFDLPEAIFCNNYNAGNFVKFICLKIKDSVDLSTQIDSFSSNDLASLLVVVSNGRKQLFCDESVYSKNRHFRIYKNTKFRKNSNLKLAPDNKFKIGGSDLEIFLHSLVTYNEISEEVKVLCYDGPLKKLTSQISYKAEGSNQCQVSSPYPEIDKFVSNLVSPGHVYRSVYYPTKNIIRYDIVGNRYCRKVDRWHKSNNVKYIFDLAMRVYYQKCYDYDCSDYKSPDISFPAEICGVVDGRGTSDDRVGVSDIVCSMQSVNCGSKMLQRFPSFGLPDEDMLSVYDSLNIGDNLSNEI